MLMRNRAWESERRNWNAIWHAYAGLFVRLRRLVIIMPLVMIITDIPPPESGDNEARARKAVQWLCGRRLAKLISGEGWDFTFSLCHRERRPILRVVWWRDTKDDVEIKWDSEDEEDKHWRTVGATAERVFHQNVPSELDSEEAEAKDRKDLEKEENSVMRGIFESYSERSKSTVLSPSKSNRSSSAATTRLRNPSIKAEGAAAREKQPNDERQKLRGPGRRFSVERTDFDTQKRDKTKSRRNLVRGSKRKAPAGKGNVTQGPKPPKKRRTDQERVGRELLKLL
ncbi:hypothetical protein BDY21DRAFT_347121, partial [Lineolata rhizophorae]